MRPALLVVRAGHLALLLAPSACLSAPLTRSTDVARVEFSRQDYCPLERVTAERVLPVPPPPERIARDPERLSMWNASAMRAADSDPRKTVAVTGCGERSEYSCWEWAEYRRVGKGSRRVTIGWVCNENPGAACPAGPAAMPEATVAPGGAAPSAAGPAAGRNPQGGRPRQRIDS